MEAVDGEKGVAMAAERRPDLILMDIQLPVNDRNLPQGRIGLDLPRRRISIDAVTSYALFGDRTGVLKRLLDHSNSFLG
jgi:two-component system cell cycle response regulator DivK